MAKKTFRIVILPGDGIGPEIMTEAIRVLETVSAASSDVELKLESYDFGGCSVDKHGIPMTDETLQACQQADAILLGAIGGPKWGVNAKVRPETGLLSLRKAMGLYANIRPANFASDSLLAHSPLKPEIAQGVDIIVLRELIGGAYFGTRKELGAGPAEDSAWDTMIYSVSEVQRITRVAAQVALAADPPLQIHSIDKANVLASSRLWRKVVTETLQNEYPQLKFDHQLVDSASMIIVASPKKLNGVILTENLFGDILSDESSVIPGSLGLLPSASLAGAPSVADYKSPDFKPTPGLYEPIHGSAPDIAGQGIANPIGTILSAAMLFRYSLGMEKPAKAIEDAVRKVLDSKDIGGLGMRTADLGGTHKTKDIGDKIVEILKETFELHPEVPLLPSIMRLLPLVSISAFSLRVLAQLHPDEPATYYTLPPLREQAAILNGWRDERVAHIPHILRKHGVDAWLMSQREYAEDTIWWSIKDATEFAPHRRTVVLFHTNSSSLTGHPNPLRWVDNTGQVWPELRALLRSFRPERIAINSDRNIAFASGLHVGEWSVLHEELGDSWMERAVNRPMIAIEYVATRVPGQLLYYRKLQESTWALVSEAFSNSVIEPGKTTTEDVEWWFREKMQAQNYSTWNHPRVSVLKPESFPGWDGTKDTIRPGDLLHVDFGISALGMHTDVQHMAYVLREGETDAPEGLKVGLRKANKMQDIVLEQMKAGKTGNQVLTESLAQMRREGIDGQIYCHPIGDWGHAPGAVMGFTNLPEHVPVLGELPILPNTYYSIELYAYHFVPERNESIRFRVEENVHWVDDERGWKFVYGRQERYHLVNGTHFSNSPAVLVVQ
ncbi:hypothetical protein EIP86_003998 [Pleurotus ostreatoroseus]|nr:hypothetical protein EIP86_003998 [Pleurotus ostreatoroseus]